MKTSIFYLFSMLFLCISPVINSQECAANKKCKQQIGCKNSIHNQKSPFHYDYGKIWTTKMFLSKPNKDGESDVRINFSEALEIIKKANQLSLGVPKIVYLVGWQYKGHDDKYPAFFEVNKELNTDSDKSAVQSLRSLMREARKHNTIVSLHINMTDAYEDSPLWKTYVDNDLISKNHDGSLKVIGNYNGKKAYQINYKNEWTKGFAQKRIDQLLELLPELRDMHTIHLDAFIARASEGHNETVEEERMYQKKIAGYWRSKGIDMTSEWYMAYMNGLIPLYWHFNGFKQADYLKYPASMCCGVGLNKDLRNSDFALGFLFGESCYGEPFYEKSKTTFTQEFIEDFFLKFPQFYFLNSHQRIKVLGEKENRVAYFSDEVIVSQKDKIISKNDFILRKDDVICFPALWRNDKGIILYSKGKSTNLKINLSNYLKDAKQLTIYKITTGGLKRLATKSCSNNSVTLTIDADTPFYAVPTF